MHRKILAALAVVASLGLAAAGTPAQAKPVKSLTPAHHAIPAARLGAATGGASTFSVNPVYRYAGGQTTPAAGKTAFAGNMTIASPPTIDTGDHSLMEFSVQGGFAGDGYTKAILEIGWNKLPGGNPYLFVSRWINGVWGGSYTGSGDGWVDVTPSVHTDDPGISLAAVAGTSKNFQWVYSASLACGAATGGWFAYYNGAGIGCYPLTLWSTASPSYTFDTVKFAQAFTEVYDDDTTANPCTDAGTGVLASGAGTRANFTALKYAAGDYANMGTWNVITDASWYDTLPVNIAAQGGTGANAYVGGPGAC